MHIYNFPQRINRAGIILPEDANVDLDSIEVVKFQTPKYQERGMSLGMTAFHDFVFLLASVGATTEEVAETIHCDEKEAKDARDEINDSFEVKTMAASVYQGIAEYFIPVTVKKGWRTEPNKIERVILDGYAKGLSNSAIGKNLRIIGPYFNDHAVRLWQKIGADGRTHSMRRAYELGLFALAAEPSPHELGLTDR